MMWLKNLSLLTAFVLFFFSCRKESFTTSKEAMVVSSEDSLHFDTVFTTTGSVSHFLKLINPNKEGIKISSIRLGGGSSSPFKINADGLAGPQINNIEVLGEDSIYVYVTVTINPTAQNLPFVVRDSIEVAYNGNRKWIQLDAFGQNAHFFRNRKITGNETWNNDLPYVILGGITVDTTATLTINKSCKVLMHADAPFIVHGSLKVNGERFDSTRVVFTGDRLDEPYRDFPASYPGLLFTASSRDNVINYATIRNAYQAVVAVNPSSSGTKLTLNETIIDNAYDIGLLGINSSITARNVLIANCGKNLVLVGGGNYDFKHSTIATISNRYIQHKDPVFALTNYTTQGGIATPANLTASFTNCIFWGDQNGFVKDEVLIDTRGLTPAITFNKVLWRMQQTPNLNGLTITGAINQPPAFDSINIAERFFSFRLKTNSPAVNAGVNAGVTLDLDGRPRPVGLPDLGAYEKQ
jgi:hypothetical protein